MVGIYFCDGLGIIWCKVFVIFKDVITVDEVFSSYLNFNLIISFSPTLLPKQISSEIFVFYIEMVEVWVSSRSKVEFYKEM